MKNVLLLVILSICITISIPATNSFASGKDVGEYCWTGDDSGVIIKLQLIKFGAYFNINGVVTVGGNTSPAYGTLFFDDKTNLIKAGYTVARTNLNDFLTVLLELNPSTLNGTKVVVFSNGGTSTETITNTFCP